jgi:hypothetical protein
VAKTTIKIMTIAPISILIQLATVNCARAGKVKPRIRLRAQDA